MPFVQIPTPMRGHCDGLERVEGQGATVGDVLADVITRHPGLKDRLFEGTELRRFVNVFVNDEDIRYLDDLSTAVSPSDELSIIPAIAGG